MNKITQNLLLAMSFIALGALYLSYADELEGERAVRKANLAALLQPSAAEVERGLPELGEATQSSGCEAEGPLPDPECTPGDILDGVSAEDICVHGYSKAVRNVTQKMKERIFRMYGVAYPVPFGSYEIDHLIPLSLGGSNEVANLWPKAAEPWPGFYEKNLTGYYLLDEVCAGRVDLAAAQRQIAHDWFFVYRNIDPDDITALKKRYANWADRDQ